MLTSLLIAMMMVGDSLTITFTGDLLLDRGIREVIDHRGVDRLFSPYVDSVFQSSNLVVANLECPVTKIVQPMYKQYQTAALPWISVRLADSLEAEELVHYNIQDLPTFFLIDKTNSLYKRDIQIKDLDKEIQSLL